MPWHKQKDGDATDWWLQQQSNGPAFSIRLTVFVSVLQDIIKIKCLRYRYLRLSFLSFFLSFFSFFLSFFLSSTHSFILLLCASRCACLCDYNTYYKCNNGRPARWALAFLVACHCCLHYLYSIILTLWQIKYVRMYVNRSCCKRNCTCVLSIDLGMSPPNFIKFHQS